MRLFTRNWQMKVMALLLSMLLWLIFHYGTRPSRAAAGRGRTPAQARP